MTKMNELFPEGDPVSKVILRRHLPGGVVNIQGFGAIGDGIKDDQQAFHKALMQLEAEEGGTLYLPPGTYCLSRSTLIPENVNIYFMQGAMLMLPKGVELTIKGKIQAGCWRIFAGPGNVNGSPMVEKILPHWWYDDSGDWKQAIESAIRLKGEVYFPPGTYMVSKEIVCNRGNFKLRGAGRRRSIIEATGEKGLFYHYREKGVSSGIIFEDLGFDGKGQAAFGIVLERVNFLHFRNVEIKRCNGIGLLLDHARDLQFFALDVRHCGDLNAKLPGVMVEKKTGRCNSIIFSGSTFERNLYHGVIAKSAGAIKFIGSKFHGRLQKNDEIPEEIGLLCLDDCSRVNIIGCQFAHVRKYAVHIIGERGMSSSTVIGNSFASAKNYRNNPVWYIIIDDGFHVVDGNCFAATKKIHGSYAKKAVTLK